MVEKSVISAPLRRRLFIVKIDVPQPCPENVQNYSTNTPRLIQVFYVTRLYAAAGIRRYRLIKNQCRPYLSMCKLAYCKKRKILGDCMVRSVADCDACGSMMSQILSSCRVFIMFFDVGTTYVLSSLLRTQCFNRV